MRKHFHLLAAATCLGLLLAIMAPAALPVAPAPENAGLTCPAICELDYRACLAEGEVSPRMCRVIFNACMNACP